jgi:release factor glutamine methyltransferase
MPTQTLPGECAVEDLMRSATARLRCSGVDRPLFEAQLLLADVLGVSRGALLAHWPPNLDAEAEEEWMRRVETRAGRVPMAYVRGFQEFYGHRMAVNGSVLVPRPETETLVERALLLLSDRRDAVLVDVCTGSGCVAAAIAAAMPETRVFASDISAEALAVARENVRRVANRSTNSCVASDLLGAFRTGCADLVTANPPYIATEEIAQLQPEVRDHEPRLAVDGGPDGLTIIRRLASESRRVLRPGGHLLMEVALGQAASVLAIIEAAGFADLSVHADLAGIPRVVQGRSGMERPS